MADARSWRWSGGLVVLCAWLLAGCELRVAAVPAPLDAQAAPVAWPEVPQPDGAVVRVPPGHRVEVVVQDLIYPTSVALDDAGNVYIAEAGYVYGDHNAPARIWRASPQGALRLLTDRGLTGPVNDLLWHDGRLFISHRGKVSVLEGDGVVRDIITGLPSHGDHHNNQLTAGPDGRLYLGQGTATNSGVVGLDNFLYLWLPLYPAFHDQPARDIPVVDREFVTLNPFLMAGSGLTGEEQGPPLTATGPFQPFGRADGETIPGVTKANGTILRFNPDGSGLEVYAWGLRNPYGVEWAPDGRLYATENGFDDRGSRPIANDPDDLLVIERGAWYGWPDFAAGVPVTDERFAPEEGPAPEFIMAEHPPVTPPLMTFPSHSAVTKLAAARDGGPRQWRGGLFIAAFGPMTPLTGHVMPDDPGGAPLEPGVVWVDPASRRVEPFARNAPGVGAMGAGLRRPVDVVVAPQGEAVYIVDIGAMAALTTPVPMVKPFPGTGVVWRVVPEDAPAVGPPGGLSPLRQQEPAVAQR